MPAQRSYQPKRREDAFSVWVEGDLESRKYLRESKSVYFTDQSPDFTVYAENTGDRPVEGIFGIYITYGESNNPYEGSDSKYIEIDLDPGEESEEIYHLDMLSYQGSATLSVDTFTLRDWEGEAKRKIDRMGDRYRIYSFVVYDRDYYKVNYLTPRYTQYASVVLALASVILASLIVALGVLQLLSALGVFPFLL